MILMRMSGLQRAMLPIPMPRRENMILNLVSMLKHYFEKVARAYYYNHISIAYLLYVVT